MALKDSYNLAAFIRVGFPSAQELLREFVPSLLRIRQGAAAHERSEDAGQLFAQILDGEVGLRTDAKPDFPVQRNRVGDKLQTVDQILRAQVY